MIEIAGRRIGPGQPCFVIAEAGVNHNGDPAIARRLVDAAADAGADAVKFQTFTADRVAVADAPKAAYQQRTAPAARSQHDMLAQLELSADDHRSLIEHCAARSITFLSSPFDADSADLLASLNVPAIKLGSGELTNLPLLRHVAALGLPLLLSTGMSDLDEVTAAVEAVRAAGAEQIALLHCVSSYPADPAEANLRAMATMGAAIGLAVGWSDHCEGVEVALAAVAFGAMVIEKHLTLDRTMDGPDHRASTEPGPFADMVRAIRAIESALGDGVKRPMPGERNTREVARRGVVAATDIAAGVPISADMLTTLRPATGISPVHIDKLIGRAATRDLPAGHRIDWSDLQ
jgi:N,N'-diacetyllegionaminate synthase